jgi:hypothetical protein
MYCSIGLIFIVRVSRLLGSLLFFILRNGSGRSKTLEFLAVWRIITTAVQILGGIALWVYILRTVIDGGSEILNRDEPVRDEKVHWTFLITVMVMLGIYYLVVLTLNGGISLLYFAHSNLS